MSCSFALSAISEAFWLTGTAPSQSGPPHLLFPRSTTHRAPAHPEQSSRPAAPQTCMRPQHRPASDHKCCIDLIYHVWSCMINIRWPHEMISDHLQVTWFILTFRLRSTTLSSLTLFSSGARSPLLLHMLSLCLTSCLVSMETSTALLAFLTLFSSDMKALWSFLISSSISTTGSENSSNKNQRRSGGRTVALWVLRESS